MINWEHRDSIRICKQRKHRSARWLGYLGRGRYSGKSDMRVLIAIRDPCRESPVECFVALLMIETSKTSIAECVATQQMK